MPQVYGVEYTDENGKKHKREFTSADSRETFMNTVRSRGGKINATTHFEQKEREQGFSLFR